MSSQQRSNVDRAKWRARCRQKLCEHLEQKLGVKLEPSQVRLMTSREDGYLWQMLPEKKHLFNRNLSDHSIKAYKELCEGVGVTFEAVRFLPPASSIYPGQDTMTSVCSEPLSFVSRISELQVQNDYLTQQLNLLKLQLEAEVKLRLSFEEKLQFTSEKTAIVQEELQTATRREEFFRGMASKYAQGFAKLIPIVNDLQVNPGITEEGFL